MKLLQKLSVGVLTICAAAAIHPSFAATATVDVEKVLAEYKKAQTFAQQFKAEEVGLEKFLVDARSQVKAATTEIERTNIEKKLEKELQEKAQKIKAEQIKRLQEIETDVYKAIEKVTAKKYDLVLKKTAVILGGSDISNDVIKELNGVSYKTLGDKKK
ncbi:MAG: OmpH family outer membrane protein [Candidatus Gastranaerophilales bacterium]|nr:OmpH family outer membrane protein [Candidatus Gastranaerophilales bacterium]